MNRINKTTLVVGMALLCVLNGCIEFEAQTLSYRHDLKSDTLYIFQHYRGIFGAKSGPDALGSEEALQLKSVMTGERTFLFNNWILEYNREALEQTVARPAGEIDESKTYEAAIRKLCRLALDHVKVDNAGFYKDDHGRLCGAQRVTIRKVSELVPALNAVFLGVMAGQALDATGKNPEEVEAIRRFVAERRSLLTLDGNQIKICVPLSKKDFAEYLQSAQGKSLQESEARLEHSNGVLTLQLGSREAERVSITLPFSESSYSGNAVSEAAKYGIKDFFDHSKAADEFLSAKTPAGR